MFSGIIEEALIVNNVKHNKNDLMISMKPSFISECILGQSIAVQGVCLTINTIDENISFYLSPETLSKTNVSNWREGEVVNVERSLRMGGRIDGHLVSGHVDGLLSIDEITEQGEAFEVTFKLSNEQQKRLIYPKGSIAIDGISLTINEIDNDFFKVMIIPHTWSMTSARNWQVGKHVHVEFDALAKMIDHQLKLRDNQ